MNRNNGEAGKDMALIRVIVADDHQVMRTSIRKLLEDADDIEVIDEASNGAEALRLAEIHNPDVLLLDMEMPGLKGIEVARQLQRAGSPVRILALSAYEDRQYILGMLNNGAAGYLIKGEPPETILKAVRSVSAGKESWLSQRVADQLTAWTTEKAARMTMTKHEMEILRLLVSGRTNQEIESILDLDDQQLSQYLTALFTKLGVSSRVAAAVRAVQEGLV